MYWRKLAFQVEREARRLCPSIAKSLSISTAVSNGSSCPDLTIANMLEEG